MRRKTKVWIYTALIISALALLTLTVLFVPSFENFFFDYIVPAYVVLAILFIVCAACFQIYRSVDKIVK